VERLDELRGELRTVLGGGRLLDAVLPPIAFAILNAVAGLEPAIIAAVALAAALGVFRAFRGRPWLYAALGLASVTLAALGAWASGSAEGFFLPDLLVGSLLTLACVVSLVLRRPLVALTSHVVRGWTLGWYWHKLVRPAYFEVTAAWTIIFAVRLFLQVLSLTRGNARASLLLGLLGGWPATIALLIGSYLYGTWRLRALSGPSVDEYNRGAVPPWSGQRSGF